MNGLIECIYKFFENPSNLAEFEEWRKERHNDEIDLGIKGGSVPNGYRHDRVN